MNLKVSTVDPKNSHYNELLYKYLTTDYRNSYIEITDKKYILPKYHLNFMEQIDNFDVHNSDIYVTSFPKAGTTWTQEMVWCIWNHKTYETQQEYIHKKFPFLEISSLYELKDNHQLNCKDYEFLLNSVEYTRKKSHPRFIKTHLPWDLLPREIQNAIKMPKIIYVYRNPKDVCVSFYHQQQLTMNYQETFQIFAELFMNNRVIYSPFYEHLFSYFEQKERHNILFIRFEDMKRNLPAVIKQVAQFLNVELSNEEILALEKHLSFESMKNNKYIHDEFGLEIMGTRVRKGDAGSYKDIMTPELVKQFDVWVEKNFANTDVNIHF